MSRFLENHRLTYPYFMEITMAPLGEEPRIFPRKKLIQKIQGYC